jgi:MGT family glycosyltransferase
MRYLFAFWAGAGAVPVECRLAVQLRERGHEIAAIAPPSIEGVIRAAGFDYIADRSMAPYDPVTDFPDDEIAWMLKNVWLGPAVAQARGVTEAIEDARAEAVVCDDTIFGAMAAAEASGLPSAALHSTVYGRIRRLALDDGARAFWESGLAPLNDARVGLGLGSVESVFDQEAELDRLLLLTTEEFSDPEDVLPDNARFVGPPLPAATSRRAPLGPGSAPVVLVSLSTGNMGQAGMIQKIVNALATMPVRGVVTLGAAMAGTDLDVPANVTVYDELPHGELLPEAAAVVTHAGHGTVMAALAYGVPLVCVPMGRDQHGVAARVEACGAGVVADAEGSPADIASALGRVLSEAAYRSAAREQMAAIDRTVQAELGVRELEALGQPAGV